MNIIQHSWTSRRAIILALFAATWAGCALTVEQERGLGDQFSRQVESQKQLVRDPVVVSYVRSMGARLVAAAGPQPLPITWNVIVDREVNAFAGPGGFVYVNTGLITRARNASELAAVMAHELSHVTLRHVSAAVGRQQQAAIVGAGIAAATQSETWGQVASTGAGIWNLRYDRTAERLADQNGVSLMRRAGYDPQGMVTMFQLLIETGGSGGGGFLSSHPGSGERIRLIQGDIAALPPGSRLVRDDGQFRNIQSRLRGNILSTGSGRVGNDYQPQGPGDDFNRSRGSYGGRPGDGAYGGAVDPNGRPDDPGTYGGYGR